MTLGERQAYETGRKDGWQEAIVALASGAKKLLGPGMVATLADALLAGIAAQPKPASDDPTEPASWDASATRPGDEDRHTVGEHR